MPVGATGASEEQVELGGIGGHGGRQSEGAIGEGLPDGIADQGAEATGEHFDGKEEREPAHANPAAAVERQAAAGEGQTTHIT